MQPEKIVFCDSQQMAREELFQIGEWLIFLDADCFLSLEGLRFINLHCQIPSREMSLLFAGRYVNPTPCTYLQRFHNLMANTWLEHSYYILKQPPMLLGGCFALYLGQNFEEKNPKSSFWGAEDKLIALNLARAGVSLQYQPDLFVIHKTNSSWTHFFRKAWLHGTHDVLYCSDQPPVRVSYLYWIRKIGFSNLNLLPLILTHFFVQRAARLFQKALQKSKMYRLEKNPKIRY